MSKLAKMGQWQQARIALRKYVKSREPIRQQALHAGDYQEKLQLQPHHHPQ
jgi:hypothetical protein